MDEVRNDYIEKALNELIPVLGIKEFAVSQNLTTLLDSGKIKECIKAIALYLGLPIEVNLSYVPKGYRPNDNDGFTSSHLVKTDRHGRGNGGITAQVSIPSNLPMYGTPNMVNFLIKVRVSEDCAENPYSFITVMAHELSHIVLYSLWHKEKENEFYTDLTAMIFGFAQIMQNGRKVIKTSVDTKFTGLTSTATTTTTNTTSYGYLSDDNFNFALNKIENLLSKHIEEKNKLFKKISVVRNDLENTKKLLICFNQYFDYVNKHHSKKISPEDGLKISAFYQYGYMSDSETIIKESEKNIEILENFVNNLTRYTVKNKEIIQSHERRLQLIREDLTRQNSLVKQDINILKKYVGFIYKLQFLMKKF